MVIPGDLRRLIAIYFLFVIFLVAVVTEENGNPSATATGGSLEMEYTLDEVAAAFGASLRGLGFEAKPAGSMEPWRIVPRDAGPEPDWILPGSVDDARKALDAAAVELDADITARGGRRIYTDWRLSRGLLCLMLTYELADDYTTFGLNLWTREAARPPAQIAAKPPAPVAGATPAPSPSPSPSPSPKPAPQPKTAGHEEPAPPHPRAAIVIDDVGYVGGTEDFIALPAPLTFAVLPFTKHGEEYARQAEAAGRTVILHLPMEAIGGQDPGPGVVRIGWTREEVTAQIEADLAAVPGAAGVNNHEGSLGTSNELLMQYVLSYLQDKGLFFLDSLTWSGSVAGEVANSLGMGIVKRDLFLDPDNASVDEIAGLMRNLIKLAKKNGSTIGICHANRPNTLEALREVLPEFAENGVELVSVADLLPEVADGSPEDTNAAPNPKPLPGSEAGDSAP